VIETLGFVLGGMFAAATCMLLAAVGEAVVERSGVLNLSIEGMMATGAATGFAVASVSGSHLAGFAAGAAAGAALSAVFALMALGFRANQVAAGLAAGILGIGISGFVGRAWEGRTIAKPPRLDIPGLSDLPVIGPAIFGQDALVYLGVAMTGLVAWTLSRTALGLRIRAVGENPEAGQAIGLPVRRIRLMCILFGGAMAGLGGAHLAVAYTALWAEGLVAGRGWIAVALVVFGAWAPWRIALGAWVFGAISLMELSAQGWGVGAPSQLLSASPYLATIVVLAAISRDRARFRLTQPLALGRTYDP
jgi:simple sugar transport system permease protein